MKENEFELNLDEIENETEQKLKVKNRFEKLSEKVILTQKEKDELAQSNETLKQEKGAIERERDFFKDFSATTSKYPNAPEFQDAIKERVLKGYTVEDATVSVLNAEGKLTPPITPAPTAGEVAGGSATTHLDAGGEKQVKDMSRDELRKALLDAQERGDIGLT